MREEKVLREEIGEYICDCSQIGEDYRWIKVGEGDYECPYCGAELEKDKIVHKKITYTLDEDGKIIV